MKPAFSMESTRRQSGRVVTLIVLVVLTAVGGADAGESTQLPEGGKAAKANNPTRPTRREYERLVENVSRNDLVWRGLPTAGEFLEEKGTGRQQYADFVFERPITRWAVGKQDKNLLVLTPAGSHRIYGLIPTRYRDTLLTAGYSNTCSLEVLTKLDSVEDAVTANGVRMLIPHLRVVAFRCGETTWIDPSWQKSPGPEAKPEPSHAPPPKTKAKQSAATSGW